MGGGAGSCCARRRRHFHAPASRPPTRHQRRASSPGPSTQTPLLFVAAPVSCITLGYASPSLEVHFDLSALRTSQGRYAVDPTLPALQQLDGAEALHGTSTLFLEVRLVMCNRGQGNSSGTTVKTDISNGLRNPGLRHAVRCVILCWACTRMVSQPAHSRTSRFVSGATSLDVCCTHAPGVVGADRVRGAAWHLPPARYPGDGGQDA